MGYVPASIPALRISVVSNFHEKFMIKQLIIILNHVKQTTLGCFWLMLRLLVLTPANSQAKDYVLNQVQLIEVEAAELARECAANPSAAMEKWDGKLVAIRGVVARKGRDPWPFFAFDTGANGCEVKCEFWSNMPVDQLDDDITDGHLDALKIGAAEIAQGYLSAEPGLIVIRRCMNHPKSW
jgi:hypothetical protein